MTRARTAASAAPDRPELGLVGNWVRALSLRNRLLAWFERNRRPMPWRRDADPYRVLISEVMSQQTRIDVVVPYFERWTAIWPDFASLAAAPESEVLAAWSGLGYYRRARSLHSIAKTVVNELGGQLPSDVDGLRTLPGVGAYTAAAVASISFGRAVPVVDGNVERVLTRLLCLQDEPGAVRDAVVREAARRIVGMFVGEDPAALEPPGGLRPGEVNQAMMELGSLVCVPFAPRCPECPIAKSCIGNRAGLAATLPRRKEAAATRAVVLHSALLMRGERFLLVKRGDGDLLAGLWELPTTAESEKPAALAKRVEELTGAKVEIPARSHRRYRHTITNRRILVHVHVVDVPPADKVADGPPDGSRASADAVWVRRDDLGRYGVSSMTKKALASGSARPPRTRGITG